MSNEKGFVNIESLMEKNVNRTNHLLGIAIDDYENHPSIPNLNNAVKDVEDFIQLMKSKFTFKEENIDFLKNENATGQGILDRIDKFSDELTENDNLIIYFSGHGTMHPKHEKGYWIPYEGKAGNYFSYLSNADIKNHLGTIKAHHIFLIVDSCFSGTLFTRGIDDNLKKLEKNPSRWGLTSGQKQIVSDGEPGKNSPFAEALLNYLRNATQPICVQELCLNVVKRINSALPNQTPSGKPIELINGIAGQFIFRLKNTETEDWVETQREGTLKAFQIFSLKYPDSDFSKIAKEQIRTIKAENAWQHIKNSTKSVDFARYKKQFPNSKYAEAAQERFLITEEDEYWKEVKEANILSRYERYLKVYRNGRYRNEANTVINNFLAIENEVQDEINTKRVVEERELSEEEIHAKIAASAIESQPELITITSSSKKERQPFLSTINWQQLPLKWIGIGAVILIGIMALVQSGIFSPQQEPVFEKKGDLYGLKSGDKWLIEPQYDTIKSFSEGLAAVRSDKKWGFINKKGETVTKDQYFDVRSFQEGFAAVLNLNNEWVYINKEEKTINENKYITANSFVDGLAAVCKGDDCGFIDKTGKVVIPLIYEANASFDGDIAWVRKDGKEFYIDKQGKWKFDASTDETVTEQQVEDEQIEQVEQGTEEKSTKASDPFANQMVKIPSGTFQMGSNDGGDDEKPVHEVTISSFYISKYEVTQKQWKAIMGANPSHFKGCDNCPVEQVSWNDVQDFL